MNTINRVFELLDQWRHLPDYQLERRADIFFAAYLPEFLSKRCGIAMHPLLVPEFPVHIGTIYPDIPINRSYKIDYVAFAKDLSHAWFVELKTDSASRRPEQNKYLQESHKVGLPALIDGVLQITAASKSKYKYCRLLCLLERISLVKLPKSLHEVLALQQGESAVNGCLPEIVNTCPAMPVEVVFLQPQSTESNEIGFGELADWLDQQDDLARRFATSLREWADVTAGQAITR